MMQFEDFRKIVREAESRKLFTTSKPLSDYDIAVQWAIGKICNKKGTPCYVTVEEIWNELPTQYKEDDAE